MQIINLGSLNVDHVFCVNHTVRTGETIASHNYQQFAGGKGGNQSVALAQAGFPVRHAGLIGTDGLWLRDHLQSLGVDTTWVQENAAPSGHAVIQVDAQGENAIVLHGGANQKIGPEFVDAVLADTSPGDILLLQNEISSIPYVMLAAQGKGLRIVLNPAPMTGSVQDYPLALADHLIFNLLEGQDMTACLEPEMILETLRQRYPNTTLLLTLGAKGVCALAPGQSMLYQPAHAVSVVDATAAGDTFIGYYLAMFVQNKPMQECLAIATQAAALCIGRKGAMDAIPKLSEVMAAHSII